MAKNVKKDEGFAAMIGNAVGHAVEGMVENIVEGGEKKDGPDGGFSFASIGKLIAGATNDGGKQEVDPKAPPSSATIIRSADPKAPPPAAVQNDDKKGGVSLGDALSLIGGKDDKGKEGGVSAVLGGLFK